MTRKLLKIVHIFTLLMMVVAIARTVYAQDGGTATITADQVNAIARQLYCPVCENITLDVCGTAACADWRNEIRLQLEAGIPQQQIIEDFVRRFGDRVVGTPLDPALRGLSLITPFLLMGGVLIAVALMLARRKQNTPLVNTGVPYDARSRYQDLFEQDIANS